MTKNGHLYEGGFQDDLYHGKGLISYPDGTKFHGVWEGGRLTEVGMGRAKPVEFPYHPFSRNGPGTFGANKMPDPADPTRTRHTSIYLYCIYMLTDAF